MRVSTQVGIWMDNFYLVCILRIFVFGEMKVDGLLVNSFYKCEQLLFFYTETILPAIYQRKMNLFFSSSRSRFQFLGARYI